MSTKASVASKMKKKQMNREIILWPSIKLTIRKKRKKKKKIAEDNSAFIDHDKIIADFCALLTYFVFFFHHLFL